jgi:hypothetical protein
MRVLKTLCCATAMLACLASGARADEWNKKTYLTFSGPVQIPGATLAAGTYLFQLAVPDTSRHVVMVSSKDGNKVYGMFITIPNERLDTPDENLVMFKETASGTPQAVRAWWYPGDRTGEEFVYPKSQAAMIAKANHRDVLATDTYSATGSESDRMKAMKGSTVGRVNESGTMNKQPAPTTTTTSPAPANTLTVHDSSKSASAKTNAVASTTGRTARRALPRTASSLWAIGLLGAIALAGAFAARVTRCALR